MNLGYSLFVFFNGLTSEDRESVLIIEDRPYDRSRSKIVALLSRVWDHSTRRYMKGFRMLTVCWSDSASYLPIDFALLSSSDSKNQLCGNHKAMDKRTCAWHRRKEAVTKSTEQVKIMVQGVLRKGFSVKYLLKGSWFMMPATITGLTSGQGKKFKYKGEIRTKQILEKTEKKAI